jgi:hypothetical protein
MPLVFTETLACFDGVCSVEEALPLLEFLRGNETPRVDLSACTYLHTALLQLLLTALPQMELPPADPDLARWVAPLPTGAERERGI